MSEEETVGFNDKLKSLPRDLPEDSFASYNPERSQVIPSIKNFQNISAGEFPTASIGLSRWDVSSVDPDETVGATPPGPVPIPKASGPAFRMIRIVGKGGFGEVWEAVQVSLDRVVAVKRLRGDLQDAHGEAPASGGELERGFHQEALTTANLDHPNIVPVHDIGVDKDGSPLLAMKYVRGDPWNELITAEMATMPVVDFIAKHIPVLVDVCQAVAFAHSRGVIHRDLKPSQVMVGEFGEVMLMDWGLAVVFDKEALGSQTTSESRESIMNFLPTPHSASNPAGTLSFMAPEQTAPNAQHIGPWTDVYLLGGTLYYLLTGKPPHTGTESREVFLKARMGDVPLPSAVSDGREVPAELEDLCMRALEPYHEDRLQTAKEFLAGLQDYLSGASKRRESLVITEFVSMSLKKEGHDYHKYADSLAELSRASSLWGENPDIAPLKELTQREYARVALENDDLVLADLLVTTMTPGEVQEELAADLEKAEARARRREHQRRVSFGAVAVLVVVIITGAWLFNLHILRERNIARQERDRARMARNDATVLVNFMLNDLKASLEPIGQLDPLLRLSEKVVGYYKKFPKEDLTPDAEANQGEALRSVALLLLQSGDSKLALETLEEYQRIGRHLANLPDSRSTWWRKLVEGYILSARVYAIQGNIPKAQETIGEALATASRYVIMEGAIKKENIPSENEIRRLLAGADKDGGDLRDVLPVVDSLAAYSEDAPWKADIAVAYEKIGELLESERDYYMAQQAHEKALNLRLAAAETQPNNADWQHAIDGSYLALSRSYEGQVLTREAAANATIALERAQELMTRFPQKTEFQYDFSAAQARIGDVSAVMGRTQEALDHYRESLASARVLAELDDQNATWQYAVANRLVSIAGLGEEVAGAGAVRESLEEALEILQRLVLQDPLNKRWQEELATVFDTYLDLAEWSLESGGASAAAEIGGRALRQATQLAAASTDKRIHQSKLLRASTARALALRRLGMNSEAEAEMNPVLNLMRELASLSETETPDEMLPPTPTTLEARFYFVAALVQIDRRDYQQAFEYLDDAVAGGFNDENLLSAYEEELAPLRQNDSERFMRTLRALREPSVGSETTKDS